MQSQNAEKPVILTECNEEKDPAPFTLGVSPATRAKAAEEIPGFGWFIKAEPSPLNGNLRRDAAATLPSILAPDL